MIVRELKLKLTKKQEKILLDWLWNLSGVYNWAIRKIKQDARDKIYYSRIEFQNLLADHGKKIGIPSHTIQGTLVQAWMAWDRCFKKKAREPKLKSNRNRLSSIPFPDSIPWTRITDKTIKIPVLGILKYHKQEIPYGSIKRTRIIRRASGWYIQLTIDYNYTFKVEQTDRKIGIDTGLKKLAILSDGIKIENQRNYLHSQKRLAQAQRGKRKKLVSRLHERIKNRRRDYNHKVSRKIVERYSEIYVTNDNLKGQSKLFGKSIGDAGISQLRTFLSYKSRFNGRKFALVDSRKTTMTCGTCGALTGPSGLSELAVRVWECSDCGSVLDRDINAANVILKLGLGINLVSNKGEVQCQI